MEMPLPTLIYNDDIIIRRGYMKINGLISLIPFDFDVLLRIMGVPQNPDHLKNSEIAFDKIDLLLLYL